MANSYTQINIHTVFTVKGRKNLLIKKRDELYKYISGILKNTKQYPLIINGYKDHVHIFFELNPTTSLSDIIKTVKANSSRWINENKIVRGKFEWQAGYGTFSYSRSQRGAVIKYIGNQKEHHKGRSFREEYLDLLNKNEIKYNDDYVFEFYDDINI